MRHLLTRTSIFLSLPNGCLCQMTGRPLYAIQASTSGKMVRPLESATDVGSTAGLKRKATSFPSNERPFKRLKIHPGRIQQSSKETAITKYASCFPAYNSPNDLNNTSFRRSPVEVLLIRQRFLYSRPIFFRGTKQITVGLPGNREYDS